MENHEQFLICVVVHKSNCNNVDDQCVQFKWDRGCELSVALVSFLTGSDPHWMVQFVTILCQKRNAGEQICLMDLKLWKSMLTSTRHLKVIPSTVELIFFSHMYKCMSECLAHQKSTRFHWKTLVIRRALERFDQKSPKYIGGDKSLKSLSIVQSALLICNHYDSNGKRVGIGTCL